MMSGFIHRVSSSTTLKGALDVGSQRVREIADRVSRSSLQNRDGFALPSNSLVASETTASQQATSDVDLEAEMTNLADAQLRFEATTKLLAKAYAQVRSSLRDR